jgi:hypothetical protein
MLRIARKAHAYERRCPIQGGSFFGLGSAPVAHFRNGFPRFAMIGVITYVFPCHNPLRGCVILILYPG